MTKETEAASAASARVAALEASLAETKRAHDACAVEQQKLARRVDESDTHASKLVAHAESLMNDLAAVKVEGVETNQTYLYPRRVTVYRTVLVDANTME